MLEVMLSVVKVDVKKRLSSSGNTRPGMTIENLG